jgi:hypothetical protein
MSKRYEKTYIWISDRIHNGYDVEEFNSFSELFECFKACPSKPRVNDFKDKGFDHKEFMILFNFYNQYKDLI